MSDITPNTKVVWWDTSSKETWEPRMARISKLYNDAELATVLAGMRRVYVYHVNSDGFDRSYEFLRKNNLVYFPTNKSGIYQGFSHKHMPVEQGKPYMLYGAAVKADDLEAGELFTEYSLSTPTNHSGIGRLLGYPECCIKFFESDWGKKSVDPIFEAALNTKGAKKDSEDLEDATTVEVACHPYCNNMFRYFGGRITPHLTHSLQCEATIKWGEEWIEIMKQIDPEATRWVIELLSMPLTWNCLKGVAIIDTPIFRGVTNSDMTQTRKTVKSLGWKF